MVLRFTSSPVVIMLGLYYYNTIVFIFSVLRIQYAWLIPHTELILLSVGVPFLVKYKSGHTWAIFKTTITLNHQFTFIRIKLLPDWQTDEPNHSSDFIQLAQLGTDITILHIKKRRSKWYFIAKDIQLKM